MDALERVLRIRRELATERWPPERFRQAAAEGKRRWAEAEDLFGVQWSMLKDAVALISPDFKMPPAEEEAAWSVDVPGMRNVGPWVAVSFVRWERCPTTAGLPNPYEPWIEIWEHGGGFSVEHGQFVDVYDSEFTPLGCIVVRRA
ncbi:MAG: hypothetical protein K8U57_16040 [Planctomycetes bacterium]|nr:hypothetical protein [Planctomycetota bacterium]